MSVTAEKTEEARNILERCHIDSSIKTIQPESGKFQNIKVLNELFVLNKCILYIKNMENNIRKFKSRLTTYKSVFFARSLGYIDLIIYFKFLI